MMISKNQGGLGFNTSFGVWTIVFGALMIMDAFFGVQVKQTVTLRAVEYAMISLSAIAILGDKLFEANPGGRLLRSYSYHGL